MFLNFISKCLEKDINKRYNIYDALRDPWVKANKYILDEKEKLGNASKFLINMVTNSINEFNKCNKKAAYKSGELNNSTACKIFIYPLPS